MATTIGGATWIGMASPARIAVSAYRGDDRRGLVAGAVHVRTGVGLTAGLSAFVWVTTVVLDVIMGADDVEMVTAARLISVLAASVAVVAGTMSVARWRLSGDALALAAGLAMVVVGTTTLGVGGFVGAVPGALRSVVPFVRAISPGGMIAGVGCLLAALRLPHVDTSLRLGRAAAATSVVVVASAVVVSTVPEMLAMFGPGTAHPLGRALLALGWSALGIAFLRDAHGRGRAISVSVAGMLFCLAEAQIARLLATPFGSTWDLAARMFMLLGALVAYAGVVRAGQDTARVLRERLLATVVAERAAKADHQAERAARDELDHDLRSALLAIGGAASTLERYADRLADTDRGALLESLTAEIGRVQSLVSGRAGGAERFAPATVARRLARCDQARGASVEIDVAEDLLAVGSPSRTAEILRNLIDNALHHGSGRDVVVRGEGLDGRVVLSVEDRGAGLPEGAGERIFDRGWTSRVSHPSSPAGLGLFVARRLAEEQGGALTARSRTGGGAAFDLVLPACPMEES